MVVLAALAILFAGANQNRSHAATPKEGRIDTGGHAQASIIGGSAAPIASYPWIAHIRYRGSVEEASCGGSVVSPRLVLTAAHCVLTGTGKVGVASSFSVLTGAENLSEATPERVSQVSHVLVFPEYKPSTAFNDAALLVLAAPVAAPPLPLATSSDASLLTAGAPVAVAGWGLIDTSPPREPTVLRDAQSAVQGTAYCQRKLRRALSAYDPTSQVCVRSQSVPGTSLCNGDSGGPAIARRADGVAVQIGIISLKTSPDCDPRSPQVLARADRVSSWVAAWTSAIELGTAAPAIVVPDVELPQVTRRDAELFAWLGLEFDFGNRFSKGRYHEIECRRVNREKVRCQLQWVRGNDYYRGGITIYAALPREGFVYNYRYTIRRFNLNCWLTYLHPIQACNPRLFKR